MKQRLLFSALMVLLAIVILTVALTAVGSAHAQAQDVLRGRLAYVGSDGNVYLYDPAAGQSVPLTDDARQGRRQYQWPTWSSDGRLAFFSHEAIPAGLRLNVYITPPDSQNAVLAYRGLNEIFNYAYWAPANCASGPGCRDLAILAATAQGLTVLRVRDQMPNFTVETLGRGGPFYYTYSPDATRMLWLRFGTRLELFDTALNRIVERLPDRVGFFQAPMWSPVDDRLLFAVINADDRQDLVIADGEERRVIAPEQQGVLGFAWSPDGRHVAYKLDRGALHVVNAATGQEVVQGNAPGVVAFFWSPDGQKIAYLTIDRAGEGAPQARVAAGKPGESSPLQQQALPVFVWRILDVASSENRVYTRFVPTRDMIYLATFFDQFAQSHRLWSPDSRALVYGEIRDLDSGGRAVLSLLNVTDAAAAPVEVAGGFVGVWSFQ